MSKQHATDIHSLLPQDTEDGYGYVPRRYILVLLCFFGIIVCYADRTNFSVAVIDMSKEYLWSDSMQGVMLSAFWYGYAITQIPAGWLSIRYDGKIVLTVGVIIWSLCTLLTPPAATAGTAPLIIVRVVMGMGEGVAFPAIHSLLARWIPVDERSRAVSVIVSGCYIGTILPLAASPSIMEHLGWSWVFYLFGLSGFVWVIFWHLMVHPGPEDHHSISMHERRFILLHLKGDERTLRTVEDIPWRQILAHKAVWAILIAQFCSSYAFYVLISWMPTYFSNAFDLDLKSLPALNIPPYVAQGMVGMGAGFIADWLILTHHISITTVRKVLQISGQMIPALMYSIIAIVDFESAWMATLVMSLALGAGALTLAGVSVNHLDIAPNYASVVFALGNLAGTLAGIIGTSLTGFILDITGGWTGVFGSMVIAALAGSVSWLFMSTGEKVII
eukprot:GILJ01005564.1.p1 GENE.GILJ01005564.1~~GILJ01005564.1.p1  ORF type:complete len:468 (-),score=37.69 GILJ01005564.1:149-1486(-)